ALLMTVQDRADLSLLLLREFKAADQAFLEQVQSSVPRRALILDAQRQRASDDPAAQGHQGHRGGDLPVCSEPHGRNTISPIVATIPGAGSGGTGIHVAHTARHTAAAAPSAPIAHRVEWRSHVRRTDSAPLARAHSRATRAA